MKVTQPSITGDGLIGTLLSSSFVKVKTQHFAFICGERFVLEAIQIDKVAAKDTDENNLKNYFLISCSIKNLLLKGIDSQLREAGSRNEQHLGRA